MAATPARTVLVPVATDAPPVLLPLAQIGQSLDYGLDFGAVMADAGTRTISALSLESRPTGTLEAVFSDLVLQSGSIAAFQVAGDIGGRFYTIKAAATLATGDVFTAMARLQFDWSTHPIPVPYPGSNDFGGTVTWTAPPVDYLTGVGGDSLTGVNDDLLYGVST